MAKGKRGDENEPAPKRQRRGPVKKALSQLHRSVLETGRCAFVVQVGKDILGRPQLTFDVPTSMPYWASMMQKFLQYTSVEMDTESELGRHLLEELPSSADDPAHAYLRAGLPQWSTFGILLNAKVKGANSLTEITSSLIVLLQGYDDTIHGHTPTQPRRLPNYSHPPPAGWLLAVLPFASGKQDGICMLNEEAQKLMAKRRAIVVEMMNRKGLERTSAASQPYHYCLALNIVSMLDSYKVLDKLPGGDDALSVIQELDFLSAKFGRPPPSHGYLQAHAMAAEAESVAGRGEVAGVGAGAAVGHDALCQALCQLHNVDDAANFYFHRGPTPPHKSFVNPATNVAVDDLLIDEHAYPISSGARAKEAALKAAALKEVIIDPVPEPVVVAITSAAGNLFCAKNGNLIDAQLSPVGACTYDLTILDLPGSRCRLLVRSQRGPALYLKIAKVLSEFLPNSKEESNQIMQEAKEKKAQLLSEAKQAREKMIQAAQEAGDLLIGKAEEKSTSQPPTKCKSVKKAICGMHKDAMLESKLDNDVGLAIKAARKGAAKLLSEAKTEGKKTVQTAKEKGETLLSEATAKARALCSAQVQVWRIKVD